MIDKIITKGLTIPCSKEVIRLQKEKENMMMTIHNLPPIKFHSRIEKCRWITLKK
jgi:hypothetical protein